MTLTPTTIIIGTVLIIAFVYIVIKLPMPELLRNILVGVAAVGILLALFGLFGIFP